jgi:hypothetical protein
LAGATVLERITRARASGARGHAAVLLGDPAELPHLLARQARGFLKRHHRSNRTLVPHPCGSADLILLVPAEPPPGRPGPRRPVSGEALCCAAAAVLRPGGFLVISKSIGGDGAPPDLCSGAVGLCEDLGLQYWQHVVALLVPVREGQLRARCAATASRRAAEAVDAIHADVFVFRKPAPATAASQTAHAEAA